jgi:predicted AAA+ superfamily ATPase
MELWPFAVAERAGVEGDVGQLLVDSPKDLLGAGASSWKRDDYLELIHTGGFPEIVAMPTGLGRHSWYETYLDTVIQRDIGQFADLHHAAILPRLLLLLATRSGTPVVTSDLASTVGLSQPTVRNYLAYLDTVFLTMSLPAWHAGLTTKAAKTPRTYLVDSGLTADLIGVNVDAIRQPGHAALGPLVETFAVTELTKLLAQSDRRVDARYFRDRDGHEIDVILETRDGRVTAIEIKASSSPTTHDFRHLSWLRDKLGDRFTGGVVLHLGSSTNSFGDRLIAAPLSALWHHASI